MYPITAALGRNATCPVQASITTPYRSGRKVSLLASLPGADVQAGRCVNLTVDPLCVPGLEEAEPMGGAGLGRSMLLLAQAAESRLFPHGLTQGRGTGVREPQKVEIIPEGPRHLPRAR